MRYSDRDSAVPYPVLIRDKNGTRTIVGVGPDAQRFTSLALHLSPAVMQASQAVGDGFEAGAEDIGILRDVSRLAPTFRHINRRPRVHRDSWYGELLSTAAGGIKSGYESIIAERAEKAKANAEKAAAERAAAEQRRNIKLEKWYYKQGVAAEQRAAERQRYENLMLFLSPLHGTADPEAVGDNPFAYTAYDKRANPARAQRLRARTRKEEKERQAEELRTEKERLETERQAYQQGMVETAFTSGALQSQFAGGGQPYGEAGLGGGLYAGALDDPTWYGPDPYGRGEQSFLWDPSDPVEFFRGIEAESPGLLFDLEEAAELHRRGNRLFSTAVIHDLETEHCGFTGYSPTPTFQRSGEFYRSNLIAARLVPSLGSGVNGEVDMNLSPARVSLSLESGPGRAKITLGHELAHVLNASGKFGLSHDQIHHLGSGIALEGVPAFQALEAFTNE